MITTPSSFSYEALSSMKFKELQKLSAQFRVNKRWAKKQELIENLLVLKEKVKAQTDHTEEENEWRNGSVVFGDLKQNLEKDIDRRLTFNVSAALNSEDTDRHRTFIMPQNGKNLLGETTNSRETYDIVKPETDFSVEPLAEARATFEIPPKKGLLDEIDPRATFDIPQNGNGLLEDAKAYLNSSFNKNIQNSESSTKVNTKKTEVVVKNDLGKVKFDINKLDEDQKRDKEANLQVKMLTIPYARLTRRNMREASRADNSPIKMSKKSINIKKTRLPVSKTNLIKSPALSSVKKSMSKPTIIHSLVDGQPQKITQSKVPVRLQFNEGKQKAERDRQMGKEDESKENMERSLTRRLSKTAEESFKKDTNSVKSNFKMHPHSAIKTPLRTDPAGRLNAIITPGCKSAVKPNTATKMPDFSKIHKRQFEQMDSLPEYLKKKEERVRKLFGIPQPGQQLQILNKSTPVFRFQSVAVEKGNKATPLKSSTAANRNKTDSKTPQKEAFKSKLPPSKLRTEIKEENRNRIRGVRTNKRFELQMKLRNM